MPRIIISGAEALATANSVFVGLNNGDVDGVIAEFLPDAKIEYRHPFYGSQGRMTIADLNKTLTWWAAAGTATTDPDCAVTDGSDGSAVTVVCRYGTHHAPDKAVGAPPIPTLTTMVITPAGVLEWIQESDSTAGVGAAFGSWLFAHHRETLEALDESSSLEVIREQGLLCAQYAQEWAEFLETRNCSYGTDCFLFTPATGGE